ncbi:MAG: flavin reductase family protein [Chloroflexi bacterium]|nr:flavin reductase family protein [Chloroflexota bacterium]
MGKKLQGLRTGIFPKPVIMVSYLDGQGKPNIVTLAGVGVVCGDPPKFGLAIRPSRYSNPGITNAGECVLNIPDVDHLWAADFCGNTSGRDTDKFAAAKLTMAKAEKVKAPLIAECPVNIECVLEHKLHLGSHDLFIVQAVAIHIDEDRLDERGRWDFTKLQPMGVCEQEYRTVGQAIGVNGFSKNK